MPENFGAIQPRQFIMDSSRPNGFYLQCKPDGSVLFYTSIVF